jgi:hypothetical protein
MTVYSIYSQLPSISGDYLLHPEPEDMPCHSDRDQLNDEGNLLKSYFTKHTIILLYISLVTQLLAHSV